MSGLMQRAMTAVVFVAVMLGGLFYSKNSFLILFGLVTVLSLWEFFSLTIKTGSSDLSRKIIGVIVGTTPYIMAVIFHLNLHGDDYLKKCLLILAPLLFLIFIFELTTNSKQPFSNVGNLFLGLIYVGIPFTLLQFIALDGDNFYPKIIFGLLILTWSNDTGAYLIGSMIGKTPLFPRISPKKTWEGSTGGVVVTFIIAWLLSTYIEDLTLTNWLILAGLVALFASVGDLVESMLKRSLGVKDSGNIMPGHGGFLDRFDAFLFLLPFAGAYLLWIR